MVATSDQNFIFLVGLNFLELDLFLNRVIRNATDIARATTPPSFDGTDRRIAYANRKYHSGWMCTGVTRGLAGFRFSTSPRRSGLFEIIRIIAREIHTIGDRSFVLKWGWNLILSVFVLEPVGFEEPVSCKAIRWMITSAAIAIGVMKWSEKNRFKVGCDTEKFPHSHCTKSLPIIGMAENKLVITVAPQNDICPHGRTYPRKAAAMVITISPIPVDQTAFFFEGEPK